MRTTRVLRLLRSWWFHRVQTSDLGIRFFKYFPQRSYASPWLHGAFFGNSGTSSSVLSARSVRMYLANAYYFLSYKRTLWFAVTTRFKPGRTQLDLSLHFLVNVSRLKLNSYSKGNRLFFVDKKQKCFFQFLFDRDTFDKYESFRRGCLQTFIANDFYNRLL